MSDLPITGILLRRATPEEWPIVETLLTGAKLPLSGARDHFDDFILATTDRIIGCIGLERYGEAGLLRSLVVASPYRGKGTGRELVEACLDHARASGVTTVVLLTETAEQFFQNLGFARVDRGEVPKSVHASAEFQGACPSSAVAMQRRLVPGSPHQPTP